MKIIVEYAAVLDAKDVASGSTVEIPDGATAADLLNRLKVRPEHQKHVVPFVNGAKKRLDAKLRDKDSVFLSVPVGGG